MEKETLLKEDEVAHHGSHTEKKSARAYLLMKFDESADWTKTYRRFHSMDRVSDCAATRGDYNLILLLQADDFETINEIVENKIMTIGGLNEAAFMPVEALTTTDNVNEKIRSFDKIPDRNQGNNEAIDNRGHAKSAASYVLLEIEKEKRESIYPALHLIDGVVFCDCTKGKFDIAMLVQGASFTGIDQMIQNKIRPLAGVLRIKELPVIRLLEN